MAKILSISSQVVHGFVGNQVTQFALQRLGHEVLCLPTVLLSNHPGHKIFGGTRITSKILRPVIEALEFAGHLSNIDAIMTGYLPLKEHVFIALDVVKQIRKLNPDVIYLCDPALGDDKRPGHLEGLYVDVKAAEAQRTELLPHADILTPNRFELEWLTMHPIQNEQTALAAIERLGVDTVLATSVPGKARELLNILAVDDHSLLTRVEQLSPVPQGSGDLMAALYLAGVLDNQAADKALGFASAGVEAALKQSVGRDELALIEGQKAWSGATPLPVQKIEYTPA